MNDAAEITPIAETKALLEALADAADVVALREAEAALASWIAAAKEFGDPVPPPSRPEHEVYSGCWKPARAEVAAPPPR